MKKIIIIFFLMSLAIYPSAIFSEDWIELKELHAYGLVGILLDADSVKSDRHFVEYRFYDILKAQLEYWKSDCSESRVQPVKLVYKDVESSDLEEKLATKYFDDEWWELAEADMEEIHTYMCQHYRSPPRGKL